MVSRKEKLIELIKNNPTLSGNQLYILSKKKGFGIQKSEHFQTVRIVRKLPEPTLQKKEKSIPIKYKRAIPILKPIRVRKPITLDKITDLKPEGGYKQVEVIIDGKRSDTYIRYRTRKQFKRHLEALKQSESKEGKKYQFIYMGTRFYTKRLSEEMMKLKKEAGY